MIYDFVVFDFGGVIFKPGLIGTGLLFSMLKENGEFVNHEVLKDLVHRFDRGEFSESKFWRELGIMDYEKLRKNLINTILLNIDPEFEQLELALKGKVKLGIISNMPETWGDELLSSPFLKGAFDIEIISGKEGTSKPDEKIYDILIEKCGCDPKKILFIDDKIKNLIPAHNKGIKTVWMIRTPKETPEYIPDYIISQLSQIGILIEEQKKLL